MPRARSPNRDKAYKIWNKHKGDILLKDIAEHLEVSDGQIRKWKNQDKWEERFKGNVTIRKKSNVTKPKKEQSNKRNQQSLPSDELTDKQRLFCIYYVKSFNATMAAIKAGYAVESAHVQGSRLLNHDKISSYIRLIKKDMHNNLFLEAMDVLNEYVKIAFANIGDYVEFGYREVENEYGIDTVTYVDIKNSDEIDGAVVQEVKQSREGVSIKLHDKMKALEKLERYFDLLGDDYKRKLAEEKAKLDSQKYDLDKRIVELREQESETKGW